MTVPGRPRLGLNRSQAQMCREAAAQMLQVLMMRAYVLGSRPGVSNMRPGSQMRAWRQQIDFFFIIDIFG